MIRPSLAHTNSAMTRRSWPWLSERLGSRCTRARARVLLAWTRVGLAGAFEVAPQGIMYFAVIRERGGAWDQSRPMREQRQWPEHAAFMNALADEGLVVLGGPLGDCTKILLMVNADSQETILTRLAGDSWTPLGLLRIATIEPWKILLDAVRQ